MFVSEPLKTVEKAETLVRWYFYFGFLGLPWLWLVTAVLFWRFREKSELVRWYTSAALLLGVIGFGLLAVWYTLLYNLAPWSKLWIIRPHQNGIQDGMFSNAIYNNNFGSAV